MKIRLQHVLIVVLSTFTLLQGRILWQGRDLIVRGYGDFAAFYTAGKIVKQGQSSRLYDRGLQWEVQQKFASSVSIRRGPLPYIRPPFEALLFLPFAYLSYPTAVVLWTLLKIAALITIPFLMPRQMWPYSRMLPPRFLQGVLLIGFLPIGLDLLQGQDSILLLLIMVVSFCLMKKELHFRSGACMGLGLFKFHLVLPLLLILIIRRRLGAVLGFLLTAIVLTVLSIAMVGWSVMTQYPSYVLHLTGIPAQVGINASVMPNLRGLLNPSSGPVPAKVQALLFVIFASAIFSMAKVWTGKAESPLDQAGFSYCIPTILLTSFYVATYDLTELILPLFLAGGILAGDATIRGWPRVTFLFSTGVLLFSPLCWAFPQPLRKVYWFAPVLLGLTASLAGMVRVLRSRATLREQ